MNNKAFSIHITQFCIVLIFWFNAIIPKLLINVLLISKIDKPKYTGLLFLLLSFSFLLLISLLKTVFLYGNQILTQIDNFFLSTVTNLICLCFLTFSIAFPKTQLFINFKKYFSKLFFASVLNLVFVSMYGFSHAS